MRAFVQLLHPDLDEGKDYRIPDAQRFREWRLYLRPINNWLAVGAVKLSHRWHVGHDATTKVGTSFMQAAARAEIQKELLVMEVVVRIIGLRVPSFNGEDIRIVIEAVR